MIIRLILDLICWTALIYFALASNHPNVAIGAAILMVIVMAINTTIISHIRKMQRVH